MSGESEGGDSGFEGGDGGSLATNEAADNINTAQDNVEQDEALEMREGEQQGERAGTSERINEAQQSSQEKDAIQPREDPERAATKEEIRSEREGIGRLEEDRKDARENLENGWEDKSPEERKQALEQYEAVCSRAYGVEPAEKGQVRFASDKELDGADGTWDGKNLSINENRVADENPERAAQAIEHESSHRADQLKGVEGSSYFKETPEPPKPEAEDGTMTARDGENAGTYNERYADYADQYDQYAQNWDKVSMEDMSEHYVDVPEAPLGPAHDNAESKAAFEQMQSRYYEAYAKYENSADEFLARERELPEGEWRDRKDAEDTKSEWLISKLR